MLTLGGALFLPPFDVYVRSFLYLFYTLMKLCYINYIPFNFNEIKRRLLLGRKVMTNLDSILKSRDITLPTKIRLVKAMVFPVAMYGCEIWTIKKAEH